MLPNGKLVHIPAQNLVMHELHPASELHPDIRFRLLDIFIDGNRRLTKRAVLLMAEMNPINIVGTPNRPLVISNWSLSIALKRYNIEDTIPCMLRRNLSKNTIHEVVLTDYFLLGSLIENHDEISRRIKAICMHEMMKDPELRELISPVATSPKKYFSLPERRRDTLSKDVMHETLAVKEFISNADKPLGTRAPEIEQANNQTKNSTMIDPLTKTPVIKEDDDSNQFSLFQNEGK